MVFLVLLDLYCSFAQFFDKYLEGIPLHVVLKRRAQHIIRLIGPFYVADVLAWCDSQARKMSVRHNSCELADGKIIPRGKKDGRQGK